MIKSIFPVLCSSDVRRARDFYVGLFELNVVYEADFYVQLLSGDDQSIQLGIVDAAHESIPAGFRAKPAGVLASFEVTDVDAIHARAVARGLEMALTLRDEAFGQRHFITVDPDGLLVDVIEPIPFSKEHEVFLKSDALRPELERT
jgi:catechol 2,3-dioxygenase-like lactoylglutathione lyase family enzyme